MNFGPHSKLSEMKEQMKTLVAIISFFLISSSTAVEARPSRVPAIYVFGDSTADVGNNNHLQVDENTRANFPHNGVDYPGGIPTGRFGNGYIAVDFLAQRMGFKESPPAYFKLTHKGQEIHGVNFASGGSGVLDMTGVNRSFSMNTQIDLFKKIKTHLFHRKGKLGSNHFLSDSLFIISTVNNDIFEFFQRSSTTAAINITIVERQISLLSAQLKNQIMKLYTLGARRFVVFGSAALGCAPFMRRLNPTGGCLDPLNQMSSLFNVAMKAELQVLSSVSNGTMKYSFVNTFDIFLDISSRPSHYGFKDLTSACCGSGRFNADTLCLPNVTYCANRREFTSWDFTHPTQAVYEIVADYAFNGGPKFATPINVKQLVRTKIKTPT